MSKLEELKAALEAATKGEWEPLMTCGELHVCVPVNEGCDVGTVCVPYEDSDANFIALAHNLMPTLIEAAELLKDLRYSLSQYDDGEWYLHEGSEQLINRVDTLLENLK